MSASAMSSLPAAIGAVTLFVDDLERSKAFYLNAFESRVVVEDDVSAVFSFGSTVVNLLDGGQAPGLVEPAAVAPSSLSQSYIRPRGLRAVWAMVSWVVM